MLPNPSHVKFTYEDYLLFPDVGRRHELIEGDHVMTPAPGSKHQRVSMRLSYLLSAHLERVHAGHLFAAPIDVVLSNLDVVQPDVVFIGMSRADIITEAGVKGAPDLCVEILSESTRKTDEVIKRKLYERHGVREYGIVDPELETMKIWRLTEGRYVRTAELSKEQGDTLTTPLLLGLSIPLGTLFE